MRPQKAGDGSVVWDGTWLDITQRKEKAETLENCQRIAKIGHWENNLVTGKSHWSNELFRMHGMEPCEHPPTYESFLERVHPDDRNIIEEKRKNEMNGSGDAHGAIQFRILLKDGSTRYLQTWTQLIERDKDGSIVRGFGIDQDITEQKVKEMALEYGSQFENLLARLSTDLVNLTGADFEHKVVKTLKSLGEFLEVEYCFLSEILEGRSNIRVDYEWLSEGANRPVGESKFLKITQLP